MPFIGIFLSGMMFWSNWQNTGLARSYRETDERRIIQEKEKGDLLQLRSAIRDAAALSVSDTGKWVMPNYSKLSAIAGQVSEFSNDRRLLSRLTIAELLEVGSLYGAMYDSDQALTFVKMAYERSKKLPASNFLPRSQAAIYLTNALVQPKALDIDGRRLAEAFEVQRLTLEYLGGKDLWLMRNQKIRLKYFFAFVLARNGYKSECHNVVLEVQTLETDAIYKSQTEVFLRTPEAIDWTSIEKYCTN